MSVVEGSRTVSSIPLTFTERTAGYKGVILTGTDSTGQLKGTLRLDTDRQDLNIGYQWDFEPDIPSRVIPVLRWLNAVQPGRKLSLTLGGQSDPFAQADVSEPGIAEGLLWLAESLDMLQRATASYFPLPADLTQEEAREIARFRALLDGERIRFTWSSVTVGVTLADTASVAYFANPDGFELRSVEEWSLQLRGHTTAPIQVATQISARAVNPQAVTQAVESGASELRLELEPATSDEGVRWLHAVS
jgi:hypothetical protein